MKRRTIMIFPNFKNIELIDEIREKYDPLAAHVRPHISLVFTFESEISHEELKKHIENVLSDKSSFTLSMKKFVSLSNSLGRYIFLTIDEGYEEIKDLSKNLYTGVLQDIKPGWLNDETFMPHMTVGEFSSNENLKKAIEDIRKSKYNFETEVNKVSVEIIDENEDSIIEMEVKLKKCN